MAQLGRLLTVATNPATQFTSVINQNAGEYLGLDVRGALGGKARGRVLRVVLRTAEAKDWQLFFFGTSVHNSAIATNRYLGRVAFTAAEGLQIGGAGAFLYDKAADIPVLDFNETGRLHLVLVNRSTATLGGANTISLECWVDPTQGD